MAGVSGGSHNNYANVQIWKANGTKAQRWKVTHDAQGFVIFTNVGSGKVLDVNGAAEYNGPMCNSIHPMARQLKSGLSLNNPMAYISFIQH